MNGTQKSEPVPMAFAGSYGPGATYAWSSAQDNNLLTTSLYTDYFKSFNKNNFKVMVGFQHRTLQTELCVC